MEKAFNIIFFNSAKSFNNARNQLEFTLETRFARYQSKFSLISGIKKKNLLRLKKIDVLRPFHATNTVGPRFSVALLLSKINFW